MLRLNNFAISFLVLFVGTQAFLAQDPAQYSPFFASDSSNDFVPPTDGDFTLWKPPLQQYLGQYCGSSKLPPTDLRSSSGARSLLFNLVDKKRFEKVWTGLVTHFHNSDFGFYNDDLDNLVKAGGGYFALGALGFLTLFIMLVLTCTVKRGCRSCVSKLCCCGLCLHDRFRGSLKEASKWRLFLGAAILFVLGIFLLFVFSVVSFVAAMKLQKAYDGFICGVFNAMNMILFGEGSPATATWLGFSNVYNAVYALKLPELNDFQIQLTLAGKTFGDLMVKVLNIRTVGDTTIEIIRIFGIVSGALGLVQSVFNCITFVLWIRKYFKGNRVGHREKNFAMATVVSNGLMAFIFSLIACVIFFALIAPGGGCPIVKEGCIDNDQWDIFFPVPLWSSTSTVPMPTATDIVTTCFASNATGDLPTLLGVDTSLYPAANEQLNCSVMRDLAVNLYESTCEATFPEMGLLGLACIMIWTCCVPTMFVGYAAWHHAHNVLYIAESTGLTPDQCVDPHSNIPTIWD